MILSSQLFVDCGSQKFHPLHADLQSRAEDEPIELKVDHSALLDYQWFSFMSKCLEM